MASASQALCHNNSLALYQLGLGRSSFVVSGMGGRCRKSLKAITMQVMSVNYKSTRKQQSPDIPLMIQGFFET